MYLPAFCVYPLLEILEYFLLKLMASSNFSMTSPLSTLSTASPTVSLLAVTTPFVPPHGCQPAYNFATTTDRWASDKIQSLIVSNPSNLNFVKCQPSGLSNMAPSMRNSFSPPVCPSGWVYKSVATTMLQSKTLTTATCCQS